MKIKSNKSIGSLISNSKNVNFIFKLKFNKNLKLVLLKLNIFY